MKRYESIKGVAEFLRKVEEDDFDTTVAASAAHVAEFSSMRQQEQKKESGRISGEKRKETADIEHALIVARAKELIGVKERKDLASILHKHLPKGLCRPSDTERQIRNILKNADL